MVVNYQKILLPILKGLEVFKSFLLGVKHLLTSLEVSVFKCVVSVNSKGIALDLNGIIHVLLCGCHGIVAIPGQGIAPWHAALTDSDLVAVTNAPVTVQLVLVFRPVVCTTLLGRSLVNEVASDWTCQNAEAKGPGNDGSEGVLGFDHGLSPCVWCPSPLRAITVGGFAPPSPL